MKRYIDIQIEHEGSNYHVYGVTQDWSMEDLGSYSTLREARYVAFENGRIY